MRYYALLFFLTLGMSHFGYQVETLRVRKVENGIVTMGKYEFPEAEPWRVGDLAEAIIKDNTLLEVRKR